MLWESANLYWSVDDLTILQRLAGTLKNLDRIKDCDWSSTHSHIHAAWIKKRKKQEENAANFSHGMPYHQMAKVKMLHRIPKIWCVYNIYI